MTIRAAQARAIARLTAAGVEDPARDARLLVAAALGVDAARLTLMQDDTLPAEAGARLDAFLADRARGRPVSRILGRRAFWNGMFDITDDVLDPRPDTEALVAEALRAPFTRVLDLGTGSGCILVSLLADRPEATGVGTDISAAALRVAQRNAQAAGCDRAAQFVLSDWFAEVAGRFDLIVSNPPYIAADEMAGLSRDVVGHDPWLALTDGADGLGAYRRIAAGAAAHLRDGGRVLLEIGWRQGAAVSGLLHAAGFAEVRVLPDLEGRDRVVSGVWHG